MAPLRVLLISVNNEEEPYPVYPLALDYLRVPLVAAGHETRIWDIRRDGDIAETLRAFDPDAALVSFRNADNNDSVNTKNYLPVLLSVVSTVRAQSRAKIVLGGSGYSLFPEEILRRSEAHCGVMGPGEHIIVALLDQLCANNSPAGIPGVVLREATTPPRPPTSMEGVASHDWELSRFYWDNGGTPGIQLKRGCPFDCVYCTYPVLEGRTFLPKDTIAAVDEIQELHEKAGINQFSVVDSVMNAIPALARSFAEEIIRRHLPIRWSGYFTPRGVTEADLALWKASGLEGIEFGVDTLCPPLLTEWGKPFGLDDLRRAAHGCVAAGVPYSIYLIFGGPNETHESLEHTIAEAQACPKAVIFAFLGMRIYPRTRLHELAKQQGVVSPEDNLLEPRFYISPRLGRKRLIARCNQLGKQINWLVVGPSLARKNHAASRLRSRGRKGALWQELVP